MLIFGAGCHSGRLRVADSATIAGNDAGATAGGVFTGGRTEGLACDSKGERVWQHARRLRLHRGVLRVRAFAVTSMRLTHPGLDFYVDVTGHERDGRHMAAADLAEDSRDIDVGDTPQAAVRAELRLLGEP